MIHIFYIRYARITYRAKQSNLQMSLSRLQVWKICWAACACLETLLSLSQQEGLYLLHCFMPTWDNVLCNCLYSCTEHSGCLFEVWVPIPFPYRHLRIYSVTVSSCSFLSSWDHLFHKYIGLSLHKCVGIHSKKRQNENTNQSVLTTFILVIQVSESISLYIPFCKSTAYFPVKDNTLPMQQQ